MNGIYGIGVDIGTTSTKGVVFTEQGFIKTQHAIEYPMHTPEPGAAEQDPDVIFTAVIEVIAGCMRALGQEGDKVAFVSFSSAMHSVIPVDGEGTPLSPCLTWADNRSKSWCDKLEKEWNGLHIYRRTGTPIHPMNPLTKLIWLRNDRPELFSRASKFISIKEYVFYKLFGQYVSDYSVASATGLLNVETLQWDSEALAVAGIGANKLSELVPPTFSLSGVSTEYAAAMSIKRELPFVVGASDGALSNIGLGATAPGVAAITIGTSGAFRILSDKPQLDSEGRTFCYAVTDSKWLVGGPVNNGGIVFRWVKEQLGGLEVQEAERTGKDAYELLTALAAAIKPGSDGLLFHPYLAGERAPLWNADARGSYYGLTLRHTRAHMVRAAMEGILYNLKSVLSIVESLCGPASRIKASGGFARSSLWRSMMADVLGREVLIPDCIESSCLGAAMIGFNSVGYRADWELGEGGELHGHVPDAANAAVYEELFGIFQKLSPALVQHYEAIAEYQRK
jgi:gluconokinase